MKASEDRSFLRAMMRPRNISQLPRLIFAFVKCYRNWYSALYKIAITELPVDFVTNDGHHLRSNSPLQFVALASLLGEHWKMSDIQGHFLTIRNGVAIKCRFDVGYDIGHVKEIFVDEVYGSGFEGKKVLDIGTSNGDSAVYFAGKGARIVVGVEPFAESYDLASENVRQNGFGGVVKLVNMALSSVSGEGKLAVAPLAPNINALDSVGGVTADGRIHAKVATTTLEALMSDFNLETVDFLKMDCEGCEYEVLSNTPHRVLAKIGEVVLEFHRGPGDLPRILTRSGFDVSVRGKTVGYIRAIRTTTVQGI